MDAAAGYVQQILGGAITLAKDIGKGGGGSGDDPSVCLTLLPIGLGVAMVAARSLRRQARGWRNAARGVPKVQASDASA